MIDIVNVSPKKEPSVESLIAVCASPLSRNLCAGKMHSAVSSFGAPRKVEGMKSRKVWVIAIEAIIIANVIGWKRLSKYVDIEISRAAIRFR